MADPSPRSDAAEAKPAPAVDWVATAPVLGLLAAAYILEIAGILEDNARGKLERINGDLETPWMTGVEKRHAVTRAFVQNLYAVLLDAYLPHEAIAFILRGFGFLGPEALIEQVLSWEKTDVPADRSA